MPTLSLQNQEKLFLCVIDYLEGTSIVSTRGTIQNVREEQKNQQALNKQALSGKALFELTALSENKPFVIAILRNLGLSEAEQTTYRAAYLARKPTLSLYQLSRRFLHSALQTLGLRHAEALSEEEIPQPDAGPTTNNLYQLLKNIYHDDPIKHHQLRRLLVEIHALTPPRNWTLIFGTGALFSAALGGLFYFKPEYADAIENWAARTMPNVVNWIGKTFSLLRNIPILMIAIQTVSLAWTWFTTLSNSTTATEFKFSRLGFTTLASLSSITAYSLMFMAGGVTSPFAIGLFILSPAIGLVKSVYALNIRTGNNNANNLSQTSFEEIRAYVCEQNMIRRNKRIFLAQFFSALFTTATVAVMSLFPATLLLMISCFAFMWLVEQARSHYTARIHDECDVELQENITAETAHLNIDEKLRPLDTQTLTRNTVQHVALQLRETRCTTQRVQNEKRSKMLDEKESILNERERDLAERKFYLDAYEQRFKNGTAANMRFFLETLTTNGNMAINSETDTRSARRNSI